jgi:hypothetical protein
MKVWYTLSVDGGTPYLLYISFQDQDDGIDILEIKNAVKVVHANKLAEIDAPDLKVTTFHDERILLDSEEWDSTMGGVSKSLPLHIEAVRSGTAIGHTSSVLPQQTTTDCFPFL